MLMRRLIVLPCILTVLNAQDDRAKTGDAISKLQLAVANASLSGTITKSDSVLLTEIGRFADTLDDRFKNAQSVEPAEEFAKSLLDNAQAVGHIPDDPRQRSATLKDVRDDVKLKARFASHGFAATTAVEAQNTTQKSTRCRFSSGPRRGETQDYAPMAPLPIGSACQDGQGSSGRVIFASQGLAATTAFQSVVNVTIETERNGKIVNGLWVRSNPKRYGVTDTPMFPFPSASSPTMRKMPPGVFIVWIESADHKILATQTIEIGATEQDFERIRFSIP